jgi:uncharacterized sulfatase
LVFEPVINIPLIISTPGQSTRKDIYTNTSNVDLLPTLLHIAGQSIPQWCEGEILPGFSTNENPDRDIFVVEAKKNPANSPLRKATTAIIKDELKLIHYFGYKHYNDKYELYNLKDDPKEISNLFNENSFSKELQQILNTQEAKSDLPYL